MQAYCNKEPYFLSCIPSKYNSRVVSTTVKRCDSFDDINDLKKAKHFSSGWLHRYLPSIAFEAWCWVVEFN